MPRYELDVGVPIQALRADTLNEWHNINTMLHAAVNSDETSAGTGFGYRDMQWQFDTLEQANAAADAVREALKKAGYTLGSSPDTAYVSVTDLEQED